MRTLITILVPGGVAWYSVYIVLTKHLLPVLVPMETARAFLITIAGTCASMAFAGFEFATYVPPSKDGWEVSSSKRTDIMQWPGRLLFGWVLVGIMTLRVFLGILVCIAAGAGGLALVVWCHIRIHRAFREMYGSPSTQ